MALAAELAFEDYDPTDTEFAKLKVQGKEFAKISKLLLLETLREIDQELSDGSAWVDLVAEDILTAKETISLESSSIFALLLRAHLEPTIADAQTSYGSMTRQFAEDLVGAAVLRQAIATIFWSSVADKSRPFSLADTKKIVENVVTALAPSFRLSYTTLQDIAEGAVDFLVDVYSKRPTINPGEIFRVKPLSK